MDLRNDFTSFFFFLLIYFCDLQKRLNDQYIILCQSHSIKYYSNVYFFQLNDRFTPPILHRIRSFANSFRLKSFNFDVVFDSSI